MNSKQFKEMLQGLADAWSRRDYVSAAAFFAEDIRYGDPVRYSFQGRDQLQAFFEADEGFEQKTTWHTVVFDDANQIGAAEFTYDGTHRYHGTVIIRIDNERISHWREYQHIDSREWDVFVRDTLF